MITKYLVINIAHQIIHLLNLQLFTFLKAAKVPVVLWTLGFINFYKFF